MPGLVRFTSVSVLSHAENLLVWVYDVIWLGHRDLLRVNLRTITLLAQFSVDMTMARGQVALDVRTVSKARLSF